MAGPAKRKPICRDARRGESLLIGLGVRRGERRYNIETLD